MSTTEEESLEREANETRVRLSETLDEIHDRVVEVEREGVNVAKIAATIVVLAAAVGSGLLVARAVSERRAWHRRLLRRLGA